MSPSANTRSLPGDPQVLVDPDVTAVVAASASVAAQVVGLAGADAEARNQMSAVSSSPASVVTRTRPRWPGGALGQRPQRAAEDQLDAELVELAAQLVAQRLVVRARQDVRRDVGDRHMLVGEERLDLAGELEPGGPGADDQHPMRRRAAPRAPPAAPACASRVRLGGLGRERVRGAGRQDEVVGLEHRAGAERHAVGRRRRRPGRGRSGPGAAAGRRARRSGRSTPARRARARRRRCAGTRRRGRRA